MRTFEEQTGAARIVFGAGTLTRLADEVARLDCSKVIVVSTPGQSALAARAVAQLATAAAGTFTGAEMQTPVHVTEVGLTQVEAVGADCVVSIGGGSATGLGKAIASRTGLPHLAIPTTYAGSEVTPILGETADGEKVTRAAPEIAPAAVIYDVELTTTLPWQTTLTSAVNALAHSVEALYAPDRSAASDAMARDSIAALVAGLRVVELELGDLDGRADLLYGSWLAGSCLGTVGMGLHHKLCHTLGGSFGLPHAPTHTVVLPYVMAYNEAAAGEAMAAVATAIGVDNAPSGLQSLIAGLGGPTSLADLGFSPADVQSAADLTTSRPYPNPREVTRDGVATMLTRATQGVSI